ncbi:MAG: precorrin-8X methylmutase [Lachnospiraceae bacterium]|nr:precorrin-8X methylmutase [Lachnospiraceae bacterium]
METKHVLPADIERTSMGIIMDELQEMGIRISEDVLPVVRRVIHTTADFDYAKKLAFTENAVEIITEKLRGGGITIVTDTNMALAGISKPSLEKLSCGAKCFMADPEIARAAREAGTTRAAASMEHAAGIEHAAFASGNAPTALITLSELMRKGFRPEFIIAVPVGFVNVVESKEEIFTLCEEFGVPCITAFGRKGGSNVAAAICNALLYMASETTDPGERGWKG